MVSSVRDIASQSKASYANYAKTKGFEDVGYFLKAYVVSGGVVTQNITSNNEVDVTDIVVSLNNDVMARDGNSFTTKVASTTYYLDFTKDGDWSWSTAHASGVAGTDYLPIAEVTTDGNKNVNVITDKRGDTSGFRLKPGYMYPEIAALQAEKANVKDYGAKADGTTNDSDAFASALTALSDAGGGILFIPPGTYLLDLTSSLLIPSNTTIFNLGTINLGSDDTIAFRATSKNGIRFIGGAINGTGVAGSAWVIYYDTCINCTVEHLTIRHGSSSGVAFDSCQDCKVIHCDIRECYFYAISDTRGRNIVFSHNQLSQNGYGESTGGRGITSWMGDGIEISYNIVYNNNEYGIRVYTQGDDAATTQDYRIIGNKCKDNAKIDMHIYGDQVDVIVANNSIRQTTDTAATGINISGTRIKVEGNLITRISAFSTSAAGVVMFNAQQCTFKNNKIENYQVAISMSSTDKCNFNVIEGNEVMGCLSFVKSYGEYNVFRNNWVKHAAATAASGEVGFEQFDTSVGIILDGNYFEGFHSGIIINSNIEIFVKNNIVKSSVHSNVRSSLTDFHNVTLLNNDWDDFASQEILRSLECVAGKYKFYANAIPSSGMSGLTFVAGDRSVPRTPTAGGAGEWVCTTAGTPGTWSTTQSGVMSSISATPSFVGQIAIVSGVGYVATGTSSTSDWKQTTP